MKRLFSLAALCVLISSFAFAQGVSGGLTVQMQNQGTPIGTFKDWLPINCGTNLACTFSNGTVTMTASGTISAAPGGSNTQIQFNNASALGGISSWTTNGTSTITAASGGVLNLGSMSMSNLTFPSCSANNLIASPNGSSGSPTCRAMVGTDIPTAYQLPQSCATNEAPVPNGSGGWTCSAAISASVANYNGAFSNATSVTILGSSHLLGSDNIIVACYDNSGNQVQPASVNVNNSNYNVTVTFSEAQTGYCTLNGTGGATATSANLTGPITSIGAATSVSGSGVVAQKPVSADAIQYADGQSTGCGGSGCSDSNDGLSIGTAKKTIDAALEALPGGSSSAPLTAGAGAVYVTDGTYANSTTTYGIWLMGSIDPNYSSPPAGWLRASAGLRISCIGPQSSSASTPVPHCGMLGGSSSDTVHPGLWISGTSVAMEFDGLQFNYMGTLIKLSICSNGTRTGTCGVQNILLDGVGGTVGAGSSSVGPAVDIGSNLIWAYFKHFSFGANTNATPITADNAAAVVVNPSTGIGSGYVFFEDGFLASGGIKYYPASSVENVNITNLTTENSIQAALWIPINPSASAGVVAALVNGIMMADCSTASADCYPVEIDNANQSPDMVQVSGLLPQNSVTLQGPASVIQGGNTLQGSTITTSPLSQQQQGFFGGRLVGQHDSARRGFGPVPVRYVNLATLPSSGTGITTGETAPDSTTGAVNINTSSNITFYLASVTPAVGDWYVGGAWVQATTSSGLAQNPLRITMTGGATFSSGKGVVSNVSYCQPTWPGAENDWQWVWCLGQVGTSAAGTVGMYVVNSNSNPTNYYGPVMIHIPSGSVSTNEAWEIGQNLQTYSSACSTVGTLCANGQTLAGLTVPLSLLASGTANTLIGYNGSGAASGVSIGSGLTLSGGSLSATGSGTTTNALTMNNGGSGAASGTTFNGSSAVTLSYNTLGAAPTASPTFTGTANASGATQFELPVAASFATLANGEIGYDTTNKNWHVWRNGADTLLVPLASGFVSGDCGEPTATSGSWVIADAGAGCGTSSSVTSVTGTSPIVSSGGSTPAISCPTCVTGANTSNVGGIIGGYYNTTTAGAMQPWTSAEGYQQASVFPISGGAWVRNLSLVTSGSNGSDAFWNFYHRIKIGGVSVNDPDLGETVVKQNAAAGSYGPHSGFQPFYTAGGQFFDVAGSSTGSSAVTILGMSWDLVGTTSQPLGVFPNNNTVAGSTTNYWGPSGPVSLGNATESQTGVIIPYSATAQSLCINTASAQTSSGSLVTTLRTNGSTSTALSVTIPLSGGAGTYCDWSDTVSISAGTWIDWQVTNNGTSASAGIESIGMELASPGGGATGMIVWGLGTETVTSGQDDYWAPFVTTALNTTEANVRAPMPRAVTAENMYCLYTTAPGTNSVAATVYQNGSAPASGLVVTIPTGGTGAQTASDTTHTISFSALDKFDLQTYQSSGSAPSISSCSMQVN